MWIRGASSRFRRSLHDGEELRRLVGHERKAGRKRAAQPQRRQRRQPEHCQHERGDVRHCAAAVQRVDHQRCGRPELEGGKDEEERVATRGDQRDAREVSPRVLLGKLLQGSSWFMSWGYACGQVRVAHHRGVRPAVVDEVPAEAVCDDSGYESEPANERAAPPGPAARPCCGHAHAGQDMADRPAARRNGRHLREEPDHGEGDPELRAPEIAHGRHHEARSEDDQVVDRCRHLAALA